MRDSAEERYGRISNGIIVLILLIFAVCLFLFTIGSLAYTDTGSKKIKSLATTFDFSNTGIVMIGIALLVFVYSLVIKFVINRFSVAGIRKRSSLAVLVTGLFTLVIYSTLPLFTDPRALMRNPPNFDYLNKFPYQLPLGLFDSLLVYLFGTESAILLFRLMNVVLLAAAFNYLGKITHFVFRDEKIKKLFYLIAPFCFQFTLYVTFCYGSFPGACLMILATYNLIAWIKTGNTRNIAMALLLSFIGYAIRINSVVFIIAFVIVLMLRFTKRQIIPTVCLILIPLLTIPLFVTGTNFVLELSGSEIRMNSGGSVLSNIAQGLNAWLPEDRETARELGIYTDEQIDEMIGSWSYIINPHETNAMGAEEAREISRERILFRLREFVDDPVMALRYFVKKTMYNWAQPDFLSLRNDMDKRNDISSGSVFKTTGSRAMRSIYSGALYEILFVFEDVFESFAYLFAFLGNIIYHKRRDVVFAVIPLVFIGQVAFSMISETRAIYHYGYFVLLMPFTAAGLYGFCQKLPGALRLARGGERPENQST